MHNTRHLPARLGTLLFAASLAACSGGGDNLSLTRVVLDTRASLTARFEGQLLSRSGEKIGHATGVLDMATSSIYVPKSDSNDSTVLLNRSGLYEQQGGSWCRQGSIKGQWWDFVFDVLTELHSHHFSTEASGSESIRGVKTTRYKMSEDRNRNVQFTIWVDDKDRLRRVSRTSTDEITSYDYYDFGGPVAIPQPPASPPPCD